MTWPRKLALVVLLVLPARAESAPLELVQLFPRRAAVSAERAGLTVLDLPLEVLRACRPGLADLRLLHDDGREIAYLVDTTGPAPWTLAEKLDVKIGRVRQDEKAPLCHPIAPDQQAHCMTLELDGPPRPGNWELVFELEAGERVERVQIATRRADKLEVIIADESIYRLAGPGERLRLPLPERAVGVPLTIVLEGAGAPPSPRLRLERGATVRGSEVLEAPLAILSQWRDRDGTHLLLDRPRALLPTALRVQTTTATFSRPIRVYDVNPGDDRRLLGEGRLLRVATTSDGASLHVDRVDVAVGPAQLRRLEVVVDDGGSPRLDGLAVRAVVHRPVLVFDHDPATPTFLYFGGGRAEAARYDLQALLPHGADETTGLAAEMAARLRARTGLGRATLAPSEDNPRFDPTPALASVARAGAPLDLSLWSSQRVLHIGAARDGLSRYVLAADDLAAARVDLGDLRVVDGQGRQWPYVIDRDVDALVLEVATPRATSVDGRTRYELPLPAAPLQLARVDLDVAQPFFERTVVVVLTDEAGRERRVAGLRLQRTLGDKGPAVLTLPAQRVRRLELEVMDGGDAPLTIERARLSAPTIGLELVATRGDYRLLAGNPDAEAEAYELRALGALLDQLEPAAIQADGLVANPQFSRSARLRAGGQRERLLVWLVLAAAVLVLGALTLRLARAEPPPGEGGA